MFTALTPSKDLLYLPDLNWNEIQQLPRSGYYCPDCSAPVFLKKGSYKLPHFAHHSSCTSNSLSPKETQQHLAGKQFLYDVLSTYFQKVHLEYYFPSIKQRADVCLGEGVSLVIEYQCSPISSSEVTSRSEGYRQCGYEVRWLLDQQFLPIEQNKLMIVKLSKFLQSCLYTHKNFMKTLTFLDSETHHLTVLIVHHTLNDGNYLVERIQLKLDRGIFLLQQPVPSLPNPQSVIRIMQQYYDRKKKHLFTYFHSKDWPFHFLVKKWKKTEQTLPSYIGLPSLESHNLGCEFLWQFKLVNYLVTRSLSTEALSREQTIHYFLLSLPDRSAPSPETIRVVTTYYDFLKQHRLPEKPFYKSNSKKRYMEAWYRFQLLAKPSKH